MSYVVAILWAAVLVTLFAGVVLAVSLLGDLSKKHPMLAVSIAMGVAIVVLGSFLWLIAPSGCRLQSYRTPSTYYTGESECR